ncbi:hypothetical protein [Dietzia sp. PP-33]|uniref:hypothetical protein n=1 Tax=Dietzia sp. PP-33 TaxID=2957500 RepID=UPI0029B40DBB|nr:hypothetical protein [Dietzia sp. PP-33]MDX2358730.1 hypothetical protein [Dietzia sp. PP-33]
MSQRSAAPGDTANRALRELDDQVFSDVVLRELHRRRAFDRVARQIDGAMKTARAPSESPPRAPERAAATATVSRRAHAVVASVTRGAAMQVPHMCSIEAAEVLARRGVLSGSTAADALRTFARDGRLIALRGDRRWVYPRFQLDHFDPRDPNNIICAVNRMLDAGHYPEAATSWWTLPSGSLTGRRAPVELLGEDHEALRKLAAAYAGGADL